MVNRSPFDSDYVALIELPATSLLIQNFSDVDCWLKSSQTNADTHQLELNQRNHERSELRASSEAHFQSIYLQIVERSYSFCSSF